MKKILAISAAAAVTLIISGSHDEPITAGGNYSRLWSAQAEYYKDTAGELFQ